MTQSSGIFHFHVVHVATILVNVVTVLDLHILDILVKKKNWNFCSMRHRTHWCSWVNCCYESHRFFDNTDNSRFIIEKICCQLGGIPCSTCSGYYPLQFNIVYNGTPIGTITRSAKACCCGTKLYVFEILFPTMATFEESMLMIGFALREHYMHYSQIITVVDNF